VEDVFDDEVVSRAGELHSTHPMDLGVSIDSFNDVRTRHTRRILDKTAGVEWYHMV
jgi:hypothetical protein